MQGADTDCIPNTAPPQPAYALAAAIRRQLVEMRSTHVYRLDQLRARLHADLFEWDNALLAQALAALHSAGRAIHFPSLRQGPLARLLGRERAARAHFIAAFGRIVACASQVKTQLADLAIGNGPAMLGGTRVLAEMESESRALDEGIDQGVTCLHDLCTQLADARTPGRNESQLATLAELAQFFMQEFKYLQTMSSMARDIAVRGNSVLARRAALLDQARAHIQAFDQVWTQRLGDIVTELQAGRGAQPHIPKAVETHDELLKRLAAGADACMALQHEEHLMAHQLGMLAREIERGGAR
jgi:hypothetical protein